MSISIDLTGKGALVTGAARGIGRAIAEMLVQAGARVVVNDLSQEAVQAAASEIDPTGEKVFGIAANVAESDAVSELVKQAQEKLGSLDIVVNNAGITRDTLLMRMKEEDWDAVLTVNLKSAFLVSKAACRSMMRTGGAIVNIASVVGQMGAFGQTNYAASKGGLIAFTKSCAREFASRNVRVNAVAPGFIQTAMTDALKEEIREEMRSHIPMGSFGQPEDVAKTVLFLVSDLAAYTTGQVVNVDGGMVMAR